jgi:diketogulonate reductase-like aldo/keto reductase
MSCTLFLLAREVMALCRVRPFGLMDIKVAKNFTSKVVVSEAQVLLRWGLQYDFALLPLSQPRRRG